MAVNDLWEFRTTYQAAGGKKTSNLLYGRVSVEVLPMSAIAVVGGYASFWGQELRRFLQTGASVLQHEGRRVNPPPEVIAVNLINTGAGLRIPALATLNLFRDTAIISKKSGVAGVKNRGRVFLPYMADSDFADDQTLNAAPFTALTFLATQLQTPLDNATASLPVGNVIVPVIYHRASKTSIDVSVMVARLYSGSQRRRINDRWV